MELKITELNNCDGIIDSEVVNQGCKIVNDRYIITRDGDLYRICKNKIKLQCKRHHTNGYLRGTVDGHDVYLHRLVALAFCENPNNYNEVNHIDGNKENNNYKNLEWCTRSENNRHAFATGLRDYAELTRMARMPRLKSRKLTESQVREIRESEKSDYELARKMGVSRGLIWGIRKGKIYKDI